MGLVKEAFEGELTPITVRRSCYDPEDKVYCFIGEPWIKLKPELHLEKADDMVRKTGQAPLVKDLVEKVIERMEATYALENLQIPEEEETIEEELTLSNSLAKEAEVDSLAVLCLDSPMECCGKIEELGEVLKKEETV